MKIFLLLLASCLYLPAQNAVYNNFSPTVKGITIGSYHCYFWLHAASPSPWDTYTACYSGSSNPLILVALPGITVGLQTFQSADTLSTITYTFTPNAMNSAQTDYTLTGKGPSDGSPLVVTGTI